MDRLLSPKRVAGLKQTKNAILSGSASVVYLADDVSDNIAEEVMSLCKESCIELVCGITRVELAKACKIEVPCAVAAVIDDGNE